MKGYVGVVGALLVVLSFAAFAGAPASLEIGVKVLAEKPRTGEVRHACTAYLAYVHLGEDLRPRPCRAFTPLGPAERRRWEDAVVRREHRLARVKRLKTAIQSES